MPSKDDKECSRIAHSMMRYGDSRAMSTIHGITAWSLRGVWMEMYESNQLPNNYNNKSL